MEIFENMARIEKEAIDETKGEIVVYQPDEITRLEVRLQDETVWLNRQQLATLFGRDVKTIGYRVKSQQGIHFRRWANSVLKEFLLKGHVMQTKLTAIEQTLKEHRQMLDSHEKKIDFFVRTSLPPVEGIFFDGRLACCQRAASIQMEGGFWSDHSSRKNMGISA